MNVTKAILSLLPDARFVVWENDYARIVWEDTRPLPTLAAVQAAWASIELDDAKQTALAAIRADARKRIYAKYSVETQLSATAGVYPPAFLDQMRTDIAAVIAASNAAEDAVLAAVSVDAVATITPTWPAI
jgi:hypothetical protein